MEKTRSKVTVNVEPKQENQGRGAAQPAGSASTAVLPLQQGAWLPANRFAVVLPEISPAPASITVSIGEGKAVEGKSEKVKEAKGRVLKIGPCGGAGGYPREMDMEEVGRIEAVTVRHGNAVDAIAVTHENVSTSLWGGRGGRKLRFGFLCFGQFYLEPGECLTSVGGHYGEFKGQLVIRSLRFTSNLRTLGPYGKEDGVAFTLPVAAGGKIIGLYARSDE
ncbi:hypothetical protein VPH35_057435 [Triticum aestivum]